jgi:hypothetical protein
MIGRISPMLRLLLAALIAAFTLPIGAAADDSDALKRRAIERLAASHDPSIVIGVGRVYVKQTALVRARAVIAEQGRAAGLGREWNAQEPEWQAAERQLMAQVDLTIGSEIEDPAWFRAAWGAQAAAVLNAEEADEIASHFATEGGALQRQVIELLLVGETLVANYTFTDRIRADVKGAEREIELLQKAWWVSDHRRIYDFTPYPNAVRFASQDPGVKYCKMLAIQGIDVVNRHFGAVAAGVTRRLEASGSQVDPYVAQFRERLAVKG